MIEIHSTEDYDGLVPFFMRQGLEFSEEDPVPTDLVKCWEALDDGRLIGGFVLARRSGEFICDGVAVEPDHRHRRIASYMMDRAVEETLSRGGGRIYLVARAPGFFRTLGFQTVDRDEAPDFFECWTCPQYGAGCSPEVMMLDFENIKGEGNV